MNFLVLKHSHDILASNIETHETLLDHLPHIVEYAFQDTITMLPFLFLAYLLIEWIEHYHSKTIEKGLSGGGKWGFVPAAILGCVPQCGFSAMAANLYSSKVITLGTLLSVFLVTSDEAVPLLLAVPEKWPQLALLLGCKILIGLIAGFVLDFVLKKYLSKSLAGGYTGNLDDCDCHEHVEKDSILVATIKHTLHIILFVFAFNLLFGFFVEGIGEDALSHFLMAEGWWQPFAAGLVGLIPNCASSILLTQLYIAGNLGFGAVIAGLCTNAGVGLAVLFRVNKNWKQNLFITGLLYGIGVLAGMVFHLAGI